MQNETVNKRMDSDRKIRNEGAHWARLFRKISSKQGTFVMRPEWYKTSIMGWFSKEESFQEFE